MALEVANTILQQLGGNKFIVMTGAKNLNGGADSLSFKVGRNDKKVTHVHITLTASDDYTIEFLKIRGTDIVTLSTSYGIYADNLREVFTRHTGLHTSL